MFRSTHTSSLLMGLPSFNHFTGWLCGLAALHSNTRVPFSFSFLFSSFLKNLMSARNKMDNSCQKTMTLAGQQQSLNSSQGYSFSKVGKTSRSRSQSKNYGTTWKVLSQGIHIWNKKALSLLLRKLWPRLKFFKRRSNFKVNIIRSNIMVPPE